MLWRDHSGKSDGQISSRLATSTDMTVIEATRGDDRVKANFLPTALTGVTRLWLINLPEGSVTSWDQLCAMFIGNF
jgi:cation transporter-like permease